MLEYASRRLTLLCTSARMLPPTIVRMVMAQTTGSQSPLVKWNTMSKTRAKAMRAAALVPTDIKAVTGAGAPSYTSGVQAWKGMAETLKAKPTASRPMAMSRRVEPWMEGSGEPGRSVERFTLLNKNVRTPAKDVLPVAP